MLTLAEIERVKKSETLRAETLALEAQGMPRTLDGMSARAVLDEACAWPTEDYMRGCVAHVARWYSIAPRFL